MARWSRERWTTYKYEKNSVVRSLFSTGARCLNQAGTNYTSGARMAFFSSSFHFLFLLCCGAVACCVFSFVYIKRIKEVRTYVHACGVLVVSLDVSWKSWHVQVTCLHLVVRTICHLPFFAVSERSGSAHPLLEVHCVGTLVAFGPCRQLPHARLFRAGHPHDLLSDPSGITGGHVK